MRLEGTAQSDGMSVNLRLYTPNGSTDFFFPIALQVHRIQHPLEPYIGREPDAVAPKLTQERGGTNRRFHD
eukprot:5819176-Prymnesium_polylepis.1